MDNTLNCTWIYKTIDNSMFCQSILFYFRDFCYFGWIVFIITDENGYRNQNKLLSAQISQICTQTCSTDNVQTATESCAQGFCKRRKRFSICCCCSKNVHIHRHSTYDLYVWNHIHTLRYLEKVCLRNSYKVFYTISSNIHIIRQILYTISISDLYILLWYGISSYLFRR